MYMVLNVFFSSRFPELWDIVANMDREKNDVIYEEDIFKNLRYWIFVSWYTH